MSQLVWDADGQRMFETGVRKGVLYPYDSTVDSGISPYQNGVAWNGLTAVTHSPQGAEANPQHADDKKYLNLYSEEELNATVEAFTYPDEFAECDGTATPLAGLSFGQQTRKEFGLCYRTSVGNDVDGADHGYKLHLMYGCKASPSERAYATQNESPEALTFSWELTTTKMDLPLINGVQYKPLSYIEIDSTKFTEPEAANKLANLEAILYGADAFSATKTYAVGAYVTYAASSNAAGKTYRCKTAVSTAGQWAAEKWEEVGAAGPIMPLPAEIVTVLT